MSSKTAILVLGMHRSGTSYITKKASDFFNASLPRDLMKDKLDNIAGHFESNSISQLNEKILQDIGSSWYGTEIYDQKYQIKLYEKYREELEAIINEAYVKNETIIIKDPRIIKLYYLWRKCLENMDFKTKLISIVRNPTEIISSLVKRDGLSNMYAELLTFSYSISLLEILSKKKSEHFYHVFYNDLKEKRFKNSFLKYLKKDFKPSKNIPTPCSLIESENITHDINEKNFTNFKNYKKTLLNNLKNINQIVEVPKSLLEISTITQDRDGWKEKTVSLDAKNKELDSAFKLASKDKLKVERDLKKVLDDRDGWKEKTVSLDAKNKELDSAFKLASKDKLKVERDLKKVLDDRDGWKEKTVSLDAKNKELDSAFKLASKDKLKVERDLKKVLDDRDGWKEKTVSLDAKNKELDSAFKLASKDKLKVERDLKKVLDDRDGWKEKTVSLDAKNKELDSAFKLASKDKLKVERDLKKVLDDRDGWKEKSSQQSESLIQLGKDRDGWKEKSSQQSESLIQLGKDRDGWKEKSSQQSESLIQLGKDRDGWKEKSIYDEKRINHLLNIIDEFQNTFLYKFIQYPLSVSKKIFKERLFKILSYIYRKFFSQFGINQSFVNSVKGLLISPKVESGDNLSVLQANNDLKNSSKKYSIIIPTYGKHQLTKKCLKSVIDKNNLHGSEIILVDDHFKDPLKDHIKESDDLKIFRNKKNLGFVGSCNHGAKNAKNDYLIFLNNDTEVLKDWAYYLVEHVAKNPKDIIGSKLIFEDGKLQESGGLLWRDASGWNVGRGQENNKDLFSFLRKVDYVSGASLCIKKSNFEKLGGFDVNYSPGYFEDADLCFKNWKNEGNVYVHPRSIVIHKEGGTSGTDLSSGMKKFQNINLHFFKQKWRRELSQKNKNGENFENEFTRRYKKSILIVDEETPQKNRDAGSVTAFYFMKILIEMGLFVTFLPRNLHFTDSHTEILQELGVHCVYGSEYKNLINYLDQSDFEYDYVMLNRCEIANDFFDKVAEKFKEAKIIFNTVDLHFLREEREKSGSSSSTLTKEKEISVMKKSYKTIVLSDYENNLLAKKYAIKNVSTIPLVFEKFEYSKLERKNFIFVGNFRHTPNEDSINWFLKNVWAKDYQKFKPHKLHIVGTHIDEKLRKEFSKYKNVIVDGFVEDLDDYIKGFLINLAPITFGAGIKGKIGHASCFGIPTITTPLGAEGMNFKKNQDICISELSSFSEELQKLSKNKELLKMISEKTYEFAKKNYSVESTKIKLKSLLK